MAKIGVFDSGYGGLTILEKIRLQLPQYDYIYLGDNARTPYGTRSFEVIYEYTWQCVRHLFDEGCELVILACNTASAKALRSIQQRELLEVWKQEKNSRKRVLGVIRPTVETIPDISASRHIGILATPGTVSSESYVLELQKIDPALVVLQEPCPMWVPLIEAGEHANPGADYFVEKYVSQLLDKDPLIDTIILGCTHYPLLQKKIQAFLDARAASSLPSDPKTPNTPSLIAQGDIVAASLADYLKRHSDLESCLSKGSSCRFLTTESTEKFRQSASIFLNERISVEHVVL